MTSVEVEIMIFRTFLIFSLFVVFVAIFGYPAYQKFVSCGILIDQDQEYSKEITPPALTLCPRNPQTKLGWRTNITLLRNQSFISDGPCADLTSVDDFVKCIEDNAYTIDEALDSQEDKESEMADLIKPDA